MRRPRSLDSRMHADSLRVAHKAGLRSTAGSLRLVAFATGLVGAAALHSTAHAIVSESQFVRSEGEGRVGALLSSEAYFVPKRVMRTKSERSHELFGLHGTDSVRVDRDAFDGSIVFRRGNLGLDLARLSLGGGTSILDRLQAPPSDNDRAELERIISQTVLSRIRENTELAIKEGQLALDRSRTLLTPNFVSLSFGLYIKGRRVEGAEITARFKDGVWISLTTDAFGAAEGRAQLLGAAGRASFETTAREKLGPAFARVGEREEVWIPRRGRNGYELIPALQGTLTDSSGQTYTLTLSQSDDSVLEYFPHRYNFEGTISGSYYQRHPETPVVTSGLPFITVKSGGLFGRKTISADKNGKLKVPRRDEVLVKLLSPYVEVANSTGSSAQLKATGDASFVPDENATISELTTYFHTGVVNQFVREHISQKLPWLDKPIRATVNLNSVCNAFYNGSMNFFKAGSTKRRNGEELSCNNTGEISDVVYHEWGHGLDDNTGGIDDGAFSEAIGDVVSMLITNSPEVGPYFIADGAPVRNLDDEYQYPPKDEDREVHTEGLIFGSTWYHLTQAMIAKYGPEVGRDTSARLFLKIIYTVSKYTDAYAAAQDLDTTRGDKGPNYCLINAAFARHGLAEADSTCTDLG